MSGQSRRDRRRGQRKVGRTGARFPPAELASQDEVAEVGDESGAVDSSLDATSGADAADQEQTRLTDTEPESPGDEPAISWPGEAESEAAHAEVDSADADDADELSIETPQPDEEHASTPTPDNAADTGGDDTAADTGGDETTVVTGGDETTVTASGDGSAATVAAQPAHESASDDVATAEPDQRPAEVDSVGGEVEAGAEEEPESAPEEEKAASLFDDARPQNLVSGEGVPVAPGRDTDDADDILTRVRPYVWTGGRTQSSHEFALETLVSARSEVSADDSMRDEHRRVLEICEKPRSVSEVAALLSVPLGVAKTLLGVMAEDNLLVVHQTADAGTAGPALELMERVLRGLRKL